jgi:tetratricopeptide (TPR) repeat protein
MALLTTLAALAGLFLTAFVVVSLLLWRVSTLYTLAEGKRSEAESNLGEAERQKTQAEDNFDHARQVVEDYLTQVSESRLLETPGLQPLRRDLLLSALKFYQAFLAKRRDEPGLQEALAAAYLRVGKIHFALGEGGAYRAAVGQALDRYNALLRERGEKPEFRAGLADSLGWLGRHRDASQEWRRLLQGDPDNDTYQRNLADILTALATGLNEEKDSAEVLRLNRETLALREEALALRQPADSCKSAGWLPLLRHSSRLERDWPGPYGCPGRAAEMGQESG